MDIDKLLKAMTYACCGMLAFMALIVTVFFVVVGFAWLWHFSETLGYIVLVGSIFTAIVIVIYKNMA